MAKFKYHAGDRFGKWILVNYAGKGRWTSICDCGNTKDVFIDHLVRGNSTMCRECYAKKQRTSAYINMPLYRTWSSMRQRCFNKNNDRYNQYGGRGITVCKDWEVFDVFLADMGQRPEGTSIDRIDVDGDYNKENCRWATPKEQMRNRSIHKLSPYVEKESKKSEVNRSFCVSELAENIGIDQGTLRTRLSRGWSFDRATSETVHIKSESVCAKARSHGLPAGTVLCRVNRGWSLEKALSTPIQKRSKCG